MAEPVDDHALDVLWRDARSHNAWQDRPVDEATLRAVYEVAKMGPTTANSQPMRVLFLRSDAAKQRLRPHLSAGNLDKTMAAPVTAVLGYDTRFYEFLPEVFPQKPEARTWFEGKAKHIETTALRNSSLQGAYFMLAARALGLDCGPMSGFDNAGVDAEFWPDGRIKSNFLCNLGYGDPAGLFQRLPRIDFARACAIL
jgi:3-hydroxypropanoate dehydrogenase